MLYPWQEADYQVLVDSFRRGSFNCLLLYGAVNSGREALVKQLNNYILCSEPEQSQPCGKCSACTLYINNNHPDIHVLAAEANDEKKNASIKVEQIREMIDFVNRSHHVSSTRIVFLPDAGQLTISSANALLKVLEEPPHGSIFILMVASLNQLLPTILSRAFKFRLAVPEKKAALAHIAGLEDPNTEFWLDYYSGEPLFEIPFNPEQLSLLQQGLLKPSIDNIFLLTKELEPKKVGMTAWLEFLSKWLSDLGSISLGGNARYFRAQSGELANLAKRVNNDKLFELYDELTFIFPWSEHPLNHKLQLERLLFKYQQIYV